MTRAEAKASGAKRYTGKPCKNGHTERYTSCNVCVACSGEAAKVRMRERWRTSPEYRAKRRAYMAGYVRTPGGREANRRGARKTNQRYPEMILLRAARRRASKLGLPFNLESSDITIPECCPILGIKLARGRGAVCDTSPSLDRIVPAKGYVKGNVQVVSFRANEIKRDATLDELRRIVQWLERQ